MRVFKRPRSPYYYFDFDLGGQTHVKSTRLRNERQALDYAAAYRLKLIKQQVGIVEGGEAQGTDVSRVSGAV